MLVATEAQSAQRLLLVATEARAYGGKCCPSVARITSVNSGASVAKKENLRDLCASVAKEKETSVTSVPLWLRKRDSVNSVPLWQIVLCGSVA
jgi:hypothetical protein